MSKPSARSLGILDVMILMIGVAIAALLTRLYLANNYDVFFDRLGKTPSNAVYIRWILNESSDFLCLWLTAITPVAFFIRMRRPRPPLSRIMRQPGATCLCAVSFLTLVCGILALISVAIEGTGPWFYYYQGYLIHLFPYAGGAVAAVWTIQWLARRFRPEASGIDRLGRVLGVLWIATFFVGTLAALVQGAWSTRQMAGWSQSEEVYDSNLAAQQIQFDTQRKKSLQGSIEIVKNEQVRIKRLVETGNFEQMKAELVRMVSSNEEQERLFKSMLDEVEKRSSTEESKNSPTSEPRSPFDLQADSSNGPL
jgi:hypothetical protein